VKQRTWIVLLALVAGLFAIPPQVAAADDPPAKVTLTMDKSIYVASQTARLTSKVTARNLDWLVEYQYPGRTDWKALCFASNVNTNTFSCKLGLAYNVKVRASLIDRGAPDDDSDDVVKAQEERSIPVKVKIGTSPLGYYVKSGRYKVFPKGSSPKYRAATYPYFPGQRCLRHQVQRRYASGWKTVFTSACRVQGKQGQVEWRWGGRHPSRVNFRLRAKFAGDAINRRNVSTWSYLRFR